MRAQGPEIHFFNTIQTPSNAHDIPALPIQHVLAAAAEPSYEACVCCGRWIPDLVRALRSLTRAPMIAWMHENLFDDQWVCALPAFDVALFVSEWQRKINDPALCPHWRTAVLRNAMNPLYAQMWGANEDPFTSKATVPLLLFAGDFARGAFHLGRLLELLDPMPQPWQIDIFCDANPNPNVPANVAYMSFLKNHRRVRHVGKVGQPRLAVAMKEASILCAPNTWPETSCIVLIEAMAAGLDCVTTNRAALPETASGFAHLIEIPDANDPRRLDMPFPYDRFAAVLKERILASSAAMPSHAAEQRAFFLKNYQWNARAVDLVTFLTAMSPQ